jgi:hypothetical protein
LVPQSDHDSGRCSIARQQWSGAINMRATRFAAALLIVQMIVSACSDEPSPPDVDFLVLDGEFEIADHWISVPIVALDGSERFTVADKSRRTWRKDLEEQATNGGIPMRVDSLELAIRQYGTTGEHGASLQICPRLTRLWAQLVCRGEKKGMLKELPESFSLLDRTKLDLLKTRYTVGRERKYDQIAHKALRPRITEMGCDKDSRFCTAAVEPLPGLLAVWTVWSGEHETAAQMAQREGQAIVEFVKRAVGRTEDRTFATAN